MPNYSRVFPYRTSCCTETRRSSKCVVLSRRRRSSCTELKEYVSATDVHPTAGWPGKQATRTRMRQAGPGVTHNQYDTSHCHPSMPPPHARLPSPLLPQPAPPLEDRLECCDRLDARGDWLPSPECYPVAYRTVIGAVREQIYAVHKSHQNP